MELGNLVGKASELLGEHGDKVEMAAEKAGELAKEKFGHDEQVDMAVDKLKDMIPGGEGVEEVPPGLAPEPA